MNAVPVAQEIDVGAFVLAPPLGAEKAEQVLGKSSAQAAPGQCTVLQLLDGVGTCVGRCQRQ